MANKISLKNFHLDSIEGASTIGKLMREKVFLLKDTGVDSKIFQFWKAKGLVDFIDKGKWARLDIIGYLWLCVLETMRKFGCSVKLMKSIYDELFTKAYEENLAAKILESNRTYFLNLATIRPLTSEESEILKAIEDINHYPILNIQFRNEISYFSQLVEGSLRSKTEAGLIIYEDGKFETFHLAPPNTPENLIQKIDNVRPHIYIPISHYITDFITDEDKQNFLTSSGLLTEDEHRIVKEIRNKNVKSIKITFDDQNHNIEKIECDQKGLIKGEDAKKVMKLLGLKNYSSIELNTRDGKTLSFVYTEKQFFK